MNFSEALNAFFGPALIIVIIYAECRKVYSTDRFLKKIFGMFLMVTFFSLITDFIFSVTKKLPQNIIAEDVIIHAVTNYMPLLLAICVIISFCKTQKKITLSVIILLTFFTISMGVNIMSGSKKLIWPVMAALLLYTYLFIIMKETEIDILTGLNNRYSFFEFANKLSRGKPGESWNIAILDIKSFKSINEIYGHLEGDNALRGIAEVIKNRAGENADFAARYGGDEFALITKPETNIEEFINDIQKDLGRLNKLGDKPYDIEIDYEYRVFSADGSESIEKLLNDMDRLIRKQQEENRRIGDLQAGSEA